MLIPSLLLLLGCPQEVETQESALTDEGEAPVLTVDAARELEAGVALVEGLASDPDQPASTLLLSVSSDLDGELWLGNPEEDGHWAAEVQVSGGEHLFTVTAVDQQDHATSGTLTAAVNGRPDCTIVEPANGLTVSAGQPIHFLATADDDSAELLFAWSSSITGSLFLGEELELPLALGLHEITLEVDDLEGGTCYATVDVAVINP